MAYIENISFVDKSKTHRVKSIGKLKRKIAQCRKQKIPLADLDLSNIDMRNIDMQGLVIENVIFNTFNVRDPQKKEIYNVNFQGSILRNVCFAQCKLVCCNFDSYEKRDRKAKLWSTLDINIEQDIQSRIKGANIAEADFFQCRFESCRFRKTYICIADFRYSQFSDCSLSGSQVEFGDFYMAAFQGTTNFIDCLWTYCSITSVTFENHCLSMKSITKLVQESYEVYSWFTGYKTWYRKNPCGTFSFLVESDTFLEKKSYILHEVSETYALLCGLYAGKGFFSDSNVAYERAKRNEAYSQYCLLKDRKKSVKALVSLFSFILCWFLGFGYKLKNVVVSFILLVFSFGYVYYIKKNVFGTCFKENSCSCCEKLGCSQFDELDCNWHDILGHSLINAMGSSDRFTDVVGYGLGSLQTLMGLLLIGFAGFIIANRIRNNY